MESPGTPARARDNPFEYTRLITDPRRAILRDELVAKVATHLQRNEYVSVLAPRQTGKTTFLHEIRRQIGDGCFYVDFEGTKYADLADLSHDLAGRIGVPYDVFQDTGQRQSGVFSRFLKSLKEPLGRVFLIDEIRSLAQLSIEFLRNIRAYYNESFDQEPTRVHKFVIAGSIDLADLTLDADPNVSPYNIAIPLHLEDFASKDVQAFVGRRADAAFSKQSIERIFEYTNGHPYLVQFLCNYLYGLPMDVVEKKLDNLEALINECAIEGSINLQSMVEHLWENTEQSQRVLKLLDRILKGERIPFTESNGFIRKLWLQEGCIRNDQSYCAIRNPIYEVVLRKNFDIRRVTQNHEQADVMGRVRTLDEYFKKLKNFEGWIAVSVTEPGRVLRTVGISEASEDERQALGNKAGTASLHKEQEVTYVLQPAHPYTLEVKISKLHKPPSDGVGLSEPLRIADGEEPTDNVEFAVRPESFYDLGPLEVQSRTFPPHLDEAIETYRFPIKTKSETEQPIEVFINVYQGVSLVHITKLLLRITRGQGTDAEE